MEPKRSNQWENFRNKYIALTGKCDACGKKLGEVQLEAHHIIPFEFCINLGRPELELDERNLICLCEHTEAQPAGDHHLLLGHLGYYGSFNLNVKADALAWYGQTSEEIKADSVWNVRKLQRPLSWKETDERNKQYIKDAMDRMYPKN
jgi:hypothetical protein